MLARIAKSLKRSVDEYELSTLRPRGDAPPARSPRSAAELALGRLLARPYGMLRFVPAMRARNQARRIMLHTLALSRFYPIGPEDWAISCPYQLGDVYWYSAFAGALLSHHGGRRVIFFTKPQHAFIARLFPSVSEVVVVAPPFIPEEVGSHIGDKYRLGLRKGQYFKPDWGIHQIMGYKNITLLDCIRANLKLPECATVEKSQAPSPHELSRATELLCRNELTPGRVAILCPQATSTAGLPQIPDEFWRKLIIGLKKFDIQCVTNIGGPAQSALEGAPELAIPLEMFRAVVTVAGHMISNRSGISDLVADLPVKSAIVYPAGPFHCGSLLPGTSLRAMTLRDDIIEVEIDCQNWTPALNVLLNELGNTLSHASHDGTLGPVPAHSRP